MLSSCVGCSGLADSSSAFLTGELGAVEVGVETTSGEELVVGATLDHSSGVDDGDFVGVTHGRESVGDHD